MKRAREAHLVQVVLHATLQLVHRVGGEMHMTSKQITEVDVKLAMLHSESGQCASVPSPRSHQIAKAELTLFNSSTTLSNNLSAPLLSTSPVSFSPFPTLSVSLSTCSTSTVLQPLRSVSTALSKA